MRYHRQAVRTMDQHLRSIFDRSLDDYDVLHQVIGHGGPIRMGDLAERLLLANSSCHRIVTRLEAADLLVRSQGSVDRREVFVDTTPAGRRLHRRMAAAHTRDIEHLLGNRLSESGGAALDRALRELLAPDDRRQADMSMT